MYSIKLRDDFRKFLKIKRRFNTENFSFKSYESSELKFGIIISKKVGSAPTRNRVKRRIRAVVFEKIKNKSIKNQYILIICKVSIKNANFEYIKNEISEYLNTFKIKENI